MSVRERSGHWHYRFKLSGRTHEGSTGLVATKQNLNVAKTIEAQKRLKAERGLETCSTRTLSFPVAAAEFLRWCHSTEYRTKPNSARRISGSFASLLEFFKDIAVSEIGGIEIERYKTWRTAELGVKDVTLRNDLNALSLFFRYSMKAGWRDANPLLGDVKVKRPSAEDAVRIHVLSEEEESAYFAVARGNLHDCAKLILLQGARPEEVLSLKKASYNPEKGQIRIEGGKTRAAKRILNLCGEAIEIIDRRMRSESVWLFPSPRKAGDHIRQLATSHDSVCQDAGVSFVLYDLRHTFATRMLIEAKVDMGTLATIMGHSSLRILQKYVHPTADHQRQAMKQYEATRPKPKLMKVKG